MSSRSPVGQPRSGEVEQVVQQPEEGLGFALRRDQPRALLRREVAPQRELGHPEDAVHGRPPGRP